MRRLIWAAGVALALSAGLTTSATAASAVPQAAIPAPHGHTVPPDRTGPVPLLSHVTSVNWGGYADVGTAEHYTKVSSTWIQPTVTCNPAISGYQWSVWWDGIDGWNSSTVEQGGTEAYCLGGQGPVYGTWWEDYPVNDIQTVSTAVKPGDHMSEVVTRSGTSYTVKTTDATHPAASFTKTFTCASCTDTSAEWVAESPSGDSTPSGYYPLAKFTTWSNSASVVANPSKSGHVPAFPDLEITMVSAQTAGETKATPSALNSMGTTFSVTWKNYGP